MMSACWQSYQHLAKATATGVSSQPFVATSPSACTDGTLVSWHVCPGQPWGHHGGSCSEGSHRSGSMGMQCTCKSSTTTRPLLSVVTPALLSPRSAVAGTRPIACRRGAAFSWRCTRWVGERGGGARRARSRSHRVSGRL